MANTKYNIDFKHSFKYNPGYTYWKGKKDVGISSFSTGWFNGGIKNDSNFYLMHFVFFKLPGALINCCGDLGVPVPESILLGSPTYNQTTNSFPTLGDCTVTEQDALPLLQLFKRDGVTIDYSSFIPDFLDITTKTHSIICGRPTTGSHWIGFKFWNLLSHFNSGSYPVPPPNGFSGWGGSQTLLPSLQLNINLDIDYEDIMGATSIDSYVNSFINTHTSHCKVYEDNVTKRYCLDGINKN